MFSKWVIFRALFKKEAYQIMVRTEVLAMALMPQEIRLLLDIGKAAGLEPVFTGTTTISQPTKKNVQAILKVQLLKEEELKNKETRVMLPTRKKNEDQRLPKVQRYQDIILAQLIFKSFF